VLVIRAMREVIRVLCSLGLPVTQSKFRLIDRLLLCYEPGAPQVPDGSAEIPLPWGGLLVALGVLALLATGSVLLANRRSL